MRACLLCLCLALFAGCSKSNPAPSSGPGVIDDPGSAAAGSSAGVPGGAGSAVVGSSPGSLGPPLSSVPSSGGGSGSPSAGGSGSPSAGAGSAAGAGSGSAVECAEASCGPRLGMPTRRCPDGSVGGNTGRCLRGADGRCGWEIRACPPGKPAP